MEGERMADTRDTVVKLPATANRQFDGGWRVAVGHVVGHGKTLRAAHDAALARVIDILSGSEEQPAFGIDDDGSFLVAIPDGTGSVVWRVKDGKAKLGWFAGSAPAQEIASIPHVTPIAG